MTSIASATMMANSSSASACTGRSPLGDAAAMAVVAPGLDLRMVAGQALYLGSNAARPAAPRLRWNVSLSRLPTEAANRW